MLVYGHRSFPLVPAEFLRSFGSALHALTPTPSHDDLVSLLVDFGEAEAAVADALQPAADDDLPGLTPWREVLCAIAGAVCASWANDRSGVQRALDEARVGLASLARAPHAGVVDARVAEGFAQYALYPEQYVAAAHRFADAMRPTRVVCLGLRSIGSALAAVVASALTARGVASTVRSVRPRGDPWDRQVSIAPGLASALARSGATHFAIVDEGPGISGSSFAAAAAALLAMGVAAERIVLFPAWSPPIEALRSEKARRALSTHRQFVGSFEETWLPKLVDGDVVDLSAGRWRARLFGATEAAPPVQPQHERRKYLVERHGGTTVFKFAGLGRHGRAKLARAQTLADAGFGAEPVALRSGFIERAWVQGRPLTDLSGTTAAARAGEYIAFLQRRFQTGARARVDDLIDMIRQNLAEDRARGAPGAGAGEAAIEPLLEAAPAFDFPEAAVDGRMLAHEWISSGDRLLKVDALDHHADDFLPACRDIAWDVAGALVEGHLDEVARDILVRTYAAGSGDHDVQRRLPFYTIAYAAYRLGYVTLAADVLGDTPDGRGFTRAASRYRRSLAGPGSPPG